MNVVSTCLFGETSRFINGIGAIVRAHHNIFSGWQLWIHHDISNAGVFGPLAAYQQEGLLRLIPCGVAYRRCEAMLWRMKPIWKPDVNYVLCRDLDSLPMVKDRRMVEAFIRSGLAGHTQSDHPEHTAPFMGGMCGFHAHQFIALTGFKSWEALIGAGHHIDLSAATGGADQQLLYEVLWNRFEPHCLHHRIRGMPGVKFTQANLYTEVPNTPLPDISPHVERYADSLCEHMGAPWFDSTKVKAFYDEHGFTSIRDRIQKAESCSPSK